MPKKRLTPAQRRAGRKLAAIGRSRQLTELREPIGVAELRGLLDVRLVVPDFSPDIPPALRTPDALPRPPQVELPPELARALARLTPPRPAFLDLPELEALL